MNKQKTIITTIITIIICLIILFCMITLRKSMDIDCDINHTAFGCDLNHYNIDLKSVNIINLYILLIIEYLIVASAMIILHCIKVIFMIILHYIKVIFIRKEEYNNFNLKEDIIIELSALALSFIFIIPCAKPSIIDSIVGWMAWSCLLFGLPMFFILGTYFLFKKIRINNITITTILILIFPIAHWFIHYYTKISRVIY